MRYLDRLEHYVKAQMDMRKLKEKKPLMFDKNKIKAKHNVMEYNDKVLRNMKKQDQGRLDHNGKAEIDVMKLKEKKLLMFSENKMLALSLKEKLGEAEEFKRFGNL